MMWRYSRRDSKLLLVAASLTFSGFCMLLVGSWRSIDTPRVPLAASTVGVFAGVEENRVNSLMQQLDRRSLELDRREAALASAPQTTDSKMLLAVTALGMSLFGLIMLNFYLDHKHRLPV